MFLLVSFHQPNALIQCQQLTTRYPIKVLIITLFGKNSWKSITLGLDVDCYCFQSISKQTVSCHWLQKRDSNMILPLLENSLQLHALLLSDGQLLIFIKLLFNLNASGLCYLQTFIFSIRVYPHQQDTGGFFIAVLKKKSSLPWRSASKIQRMAHKKMLPWEFLQKVCR